MKSRIAIVCSIFWFFLVLAGMEPWQKITRWHKTGWDDFIFVAVLPLIVLWGIWWILKARAK
jgi:hypothetical protein